MASQTQTQTPVLLHGDLHLWIIEACDLPNMDYFSESLRRCFVTPCPNLLLSQKRSGEVTTDTNTDPDPRPRHRHGTIITSDPYVTVSIAGATVARTRVISNSQDPYWDEDFEIPLAHCADFIEFQIKDNDVFGSQLIGTVRIPTSTVASEKVDGWFQVEDSTKKLRKHESALRLKMQFSPVELNPLYQNGIAGDPEEKGVRNAYFPLRTNCRVTLYQDAHVNDGDLEKIRIEDGMDFEHGKCWQDIFQAISEAKHLIYIMGWSIFTEVRLVRREPLESLPEVEKLTLGELLKRKAKDKVRVCLLVWDERTSREVGCFKTVSGFWFYLVALLYYICCF